MSKHPLTQNQVEALKFVFSKEGSRWKAALREMWQSGYPRSYGPVVSASLQQIRNTLGPEWLAKVDLEKLLAEAEPPQEKENCLTCKFRPQWDGPLEMIGGHPWMFTGECPYRTGRSPYNGKEVFGSKTSVILDLHTQQVWEDGCSSLDGCEKWEPEDEPVKAIGTVPAPGKGPIQADGTCSRCGRDYDGELPEGAACPSDDCPSWDQSPVIDVGVQVYGYGKWLFRGDVVSVSRGEEGKNQWRKSLGITLDIRTGRLMDLEIHHVEPDEPFEDLYHYIRLPQGDFPLNDEMELESEGLALLQAFIKAEQECAVARRRALLIAMRQ